MAAGVLHRASGKLISLLGGALYAVAWLACLCYLLHAIFAQSASWTWGSEGSWQGMRQQLEQRYTMVKGKAKYMVLSGRDTENILLSMLPLAVAAAAVTAALWLKASTKGACYTPGNADCITDNGENKHHPTPTLWHQVKQACGWQVPPRAFWLRCCEGLSALEALLIVGWAILHIVIVADITMYQARSFVAWDAAGLYYNAPKSVYILEDIGLGWGFALWFDLALLFCPIAHNSFINHLTGLPYSALVRYHRWIGHSTMITTTLHAFFFYALWLCNPEMNFWEYALDWNKLGGVNYLAGTISWLFGLVLWVTALEWVRRRFFEVFYKSHVTCFMGFVVFGIIHYSGNPRVFIPGLALYFADLVMRVCQAQNISAVTLAGHAAQAKGIVTHGDVVVLHIPLAKDAAVSAGQDLYLLAPFISRWQWHPFTIASVQEEGPGTPDASIVIADKDASLKDVSHGMASEGRSATLYIKACGSWTQALHSQLLAHSSIPVRIMGPFGAINMDAYFTPKPLLLVAGGVGVAPVLAILSRLVAARANGSAFVPAYVRLLWVARHSEEFSVLDESLARAASDNGDWLSMSLHCTQLEARKPAFSEPKPVHPDSLVHLDAKDASSRHPYQGRPAPPCTSTPSGCPVGWLASQAGSAGASVMAAARSASGYFWGAVRPMQPQALGSSVHKAELYRLAVLLLVLLGGVMGMVLSYAMNIEWRTIPKAGTTMRWKIGLLYTVIMAVQMIGLPMALVVFPTHLYRYIARSKKDAINIMELQSTHSMPALVHDMLVYHESGVSVSIQAGRPDLAAAVQWAVDTAGGKDSAPEASVVCAGPTPLNHAVRQLVAQHNSSQKATTAKQVNLHYHQETFEL